MTHQARTVRRRRNAVSMVPMAVLLTLAATGTASARPWSADLPSPPAYAVPQPGPAVDTPELAGLAATAAAAASEAQQRLMDDYPSGPLPGLASAAGVSSPWSTQGEVALTWAMEQIGKPYVWGAEGPDAFDCSGLSSQAWHAAGVDIPRTSQEQWHLLPRVTDGRLLLGDLVIFFDDASHVGLYAGHGLIVQAPRPGRTVSVPEISAMPVLGVVRPSLH